MSNRILYLHGEMDEKVIGPQLQDVNFLGSFYGEMIVEFIHVVPGKNVALILNKDCRFHNKSFIMCREAVAEWLRRIPTHTMMIFRMDLSFNQESRKFTPFVTDAVFADPMIKIYMGEWRPKLWQQRQYSKKSGQL